MHALARALMNPSRTRTRRVPKRKLGGYDYRFSDGSAIAAASASDSDQPSATAAAAAEITAADGIVDEAPEGVAAVPPRLCDMERLCWRRFLRPRPTPIPNSGSYKSSESSSSSLLETSGMAVVPTMTCAPELGCELDSDVSVSSLSI